VAEDDLREMPIMEHLAELRRTVFWSAGFAIVAAVLAWFFAEPIVDRLLRPAATASDKPLIFTGPMEAFILKIKAAAVVGVFLVLPLILHRIYLFVIPGLHARERRWATPLLASAIVLFYTGVAFCLFILMPIVIRFGLDQATEWLQPMLRATEYFGFVARLCLAFGLLFELPMVVFALSWAGVVSPRLLLRGWRYALVSILVVSALLTPPDVVSQIMLAAPVMLLYLLSCVVSIAVTRHRQRPADGN
jgi:sec-independent protein translocase protein TatC